MVHCNVSYKSIFKKKCMFSIKLKLFFRGFLASRSNLIIQIYTLDIDVQHYYRYTFILQTHIGDDIIHIYICVYTDDGITVAGERN